MKDVRCESGDHDWEPCKGIVMATGHPPVYTEVARVMGCHRDGCGLHRIEMIAKPNDNIIAEEIV